MAEQIVSDPNTEVDDWLDSDDPNDVGEVTTEPGADSEPGTGEPGAEDGVIDGSVDEPVTGDDT